MQGEKQARTEGHAAGSAALELRRDPPAMPGPSGDKIGEGSPPDGDCIPPRAGPDFLSLTVLEEAYADAFPHRHCSPLVGAPTPPSLGFDPLGLTPKLRPVAQSRLPGTPELRPMAPLRSPSPLLLPAGLPAPESPAVPGTPEVCPRRPPQSLPALCLAAGVGPTGLDPSPLYLAAGGNQPGPAGVRLNLAGTAIEMQSGSSEAEMAPLVRGTRSPRVLFGYQQQPQRQHHLQSAAVGPAISSGTPMSRRLSHAMSTEEQTAVARAGEYITMMMSFSSSRDITAAASREARPQGAAVDVWMEDQEMTSARPADADADASTSLEPTSSVTMAGNTEARSGEDSEFLDSVLIRGPLGRLFVGTEMKSRTGPAEGHLTLVPTLQKGEKGHITHDMCALPRCQSGCAQEPNRVGQGQGNSDWCLEGLRQRQMNSDWCLEGVQILENAEGLMSPTSEGGARPWGPVLEGPDTFVFAAPDDSDSDSDFEEIPLKQHRGIIEGLHIVLPKPRPPSPPTLEELRGIAPLFDPRHIASFKRKKAAFVFLLLIGSLLYFVSFIVGLLTASGTISVADVGMRLMSQSMLTSGNTWVALANLILYLSMDLIGLCGAMLEYSPVISLYICVEIVIGIVSAMAGLHFLLLYRAVVIMVAYDVRYSALLLMEAERHLRARLMGHPLPTPDMNTWLARLRFFPGRSQDMYAHTVFLYQYPLTILRGWTLRQLQRAPSLSIPRANSAQT